MIEPVYIASTVGIAVPVSQDWYFHADTTCNLTVGAGAAANPGMSIR